MGLAFCDGLLTHLEQNVYENNSIYIFFQTANLLKSFKNGTSMGNRKGYYNLKCSRWLLGREATVTYRRMCFLPT